MSGDSGQADGLWSLVLEEAAQAAINATILGGATTIPEELLDYTRQRAGLRRAGRGSRGRVYGVETSSGAIPAKISCPRKQ